MTIVLALNIIGAVFVTIGVVTPLAWAIRTQLNDSTASVPVPQQRRGLDRRPPSMQRRPVPADRPTAERRTASRGWGTGLTA